MPRISRLIARDLNPGVWQVLPGLHFLLPVVHLDMKHIITQIKKRET